MVQVSERLVVQLDGGRGGSTEHVLERRVFGVAVGRQAGILLLEDGQCQHVAMETGTDGKYERERER